MPANTNPDPVKLLSDDEVAEVAAMFPHAEYQPTLNADQVDPCEFCKGTIDDHKANCVVPHVHALCATVRALRAESADDHRILSGAVHEAEANRDNAIKLLEQTRQRLTVKSGLLDKTMAQALELDTQNTALREQLDQRERERQELWFFLTRRPTSELSHKELIAIHKDMANERDELKDQLAQVTQERDRLQEQLAEEVAKRVNSNVEQMEQSQKITQADLKRHCSDDRLTDTQRGSYQD